MIDINRCYKIDVIFHTRHKPLSYMEAYMYILLCMCVSLRMIYAILLVLVLAAESVSVCIWIRLKCGHKIMCIFYRKPKTIYIYICCCCCFFYFSASSSWSSPSSSIYSGGLKMCVCTLVVARCNTNHIPYNYICKYMIYIYNERAREAERERRGQQDGWLRHDDMSG